MHQISESAKVENGVILGNEVVIGNNVTIKAGTIIQDNVQIGDGAYIDYYSILRDNVKIGCHAYIGANSIIGEYTTRFCKTRSNSVCHPVCIGKDAVIRSHSVIYGDVIIGDGFQTGHHVMLRERTKIGNYVSVGSFSNIESSCSIGNYVRLHSNVFLGEYTRIDDYVWIFAKVAFTNDPTPPSDKLLETHVHPFAVIATGAVILPGIQINQDSLIAAGAVVTKSVDRYMVVAGNPAKCIKDIRNIKSKDSDKSAYPWRYQFKRGMPWKEKGFEDWYIELPDKGKAFLNIDETIYVDK